MSIVRVGLSETKKFAEGYEAIFGKKDSAVEADESGKKKAAKKKPKGAGRKKPKAKKK